MQESIKPPKQRSLGLLAEAPQGIDASSRARLAQEGLVCIRGNSVRPCKGPAMKDATGISGSAGMLTCDASTVTDAARPSPEGRPATIKGTTVDRPATARAASARRP
jgi:hypothetical protein